MNKQIALGEFATTVKPVVSQGFGYLGGDSNSSVGSSSHLCGLATVLGSTLHIAGGQQRWIYHKAEGADAS